MGTALAIGPHFTPLFSVNSSSLSLSLVLSSLTAAGAPVEPILNSPMKMLSETLEWASLDAEPRQERQRLAFLQAPAPRPGLNFFVHLDPFCYTAVDV